MPGLGRRAQPQHRAGQVDRAQLFRPAVVFRHVGKAPERPQPAVDGDLPAGLFEHLAVQRGDRVFAGVDAAAGQLELGRRFGLMRDQDLGAPPQHGIDPGSEAVSLAGLHGLAETADHGRPLVMAALAPI
jgi:hypothetical protein